MTLEQMQAALERAKREKQTGMAIYWQALIDEMLAKQKKIKIISFSYFTYGRAHTIMSYME